MKTHERTGSPARAVQAMPLEIYGGMQDAVIRFYFRSGTVLFNF